MTSIESSVSRAETLIGLLEAHADKAVAGQPSDQIYSDAVRCRTEVLKSLITGGSDVVYGVACSYMEDIKPIAEVAFGVELDSHQIGEFQDYELTAFPGLLGRMRVVESDETNGPLIALDFLGAGD